MSGRGTYLRRQEDFKTFDLKREAADRAMGAIRNLIIANRTTYRAAFSLEDTHDLLVDLYHGNREGLARRGLSPFWPFLGENDFSSYLSEESVNDFGGNVVAMQRFVTSIVRETINYLSAVIIHMSVSVGATVAEGDYSSTALPRSAVLVLPPGFIGTFYYNYLVNEEFNPNYEGAGEGMGLLIHLGDVPSGGQGQVQMLGPAYASSMRNRADIMVTSERFSTYGTFGSYVESYSEREYRRIMATLPPDFLPSPGNSLLRRYRKTDGGDNAIVFSAEAIMVSEDYVLVKNSYAVLIYLRTLLSKSKV
jgi:hypothetical protein